MLKVYGDESMDEKKKRVCAVAGVVGTESQWLQLETLWLERTDGLVFHANDCDSDQGDYATKPHQENKALYKDLTLLLAKSGLNGIGANIDIIAQSRYFPHMKSDRSYYPAFMHFLEWLKNHVEGRDEIAEITLDSRIESNHNAALVYANLREERPDWKIRLASKLSFESSTDNPRVQVADLLARETMKALDNAIGPTKRTVRRSWAALRATGRFEAYSYSEDWFRDFVADMSKLKDETGISNKTYADWLQQRKRSDHVTAILEFCFSAKNKKS